MKLLSLFSGIGAFEKALTRLQIDYELVGFSEIDKYAIKSYCRIHDVDPGMNLGDIKQIDEKTLPKDIDLVTYGFPCQDISIAGTMRGFEDEEGKQTRSGLFFDALRIIKEAQPKVAIAENVGNILSKGMSNVFESVMQSLLDAGYQTGCYVLNAKDFGVPQSRKRVFFVSLRNDVYDDILTRCDDVFYYLKSDVIPLTKSLDDVLQPDDDVDEKYYLSYKLVEGFQAASDRAKEKGLGFRFEPYTRGGAESK